MLAFEAELSHGVQGIGRSAKSIGYLGVQGTHNPSQKSFRLPQKQPSSPAMQGLGQLMAGRTDSSQNEGKL